MKKRIATLVQDSIEAKQKLLADDQLQAVEAIAQRIIAAYRAGKKVLIMGNGGSAADAQHFAAELVCRFEKNRAALAALALTTDTSVLTAIGNDFGYNDTFSRQVEALAASGDIVIGISTSGNSPNVIKAFERARQQGAVTVGFTGTPGGTLRQYTDLCFNAPSPVTGRIQECHSLVIHILCALVEETLFAKN